MNGIASKMVVTCLLITTGVGLVLPVRAQNRSGRGGRGDAKTPAPAPKGKTVPRDQVLSEAEARLAETEEKFAAMKRQLEEPPPKRTFKVEARGVQKTKLFRADPKLLENKVLATVVLLISPKDANSMDEGGGFGLGPRRIQQTDRRLADPSFPGPSFQSDRYPDHLLPLNRWDNVTLFSPGVGTNRHDQIKLSQQFKLFLDHCLPSERPSNPAVNFLVSDECDRDVRRTHFSRSSQEEGWDFSLFAPSSEEAEQRVAALLQLLDGGVLRPMQRHFLTQGQKSLLQSKDHFKEVAKQAAELQKEEDKLAKPSEISADILSQLKAQKVMVAVELAGLNARVKACDEMLKEPGKLQVSALQSISDMKVKAEIERVGIREKLDQINIFIGEGENRRITQGRIAEMQGAFDNELRTARGYEIEADIFSRLYDLYAPLPLKDDRITINQVEWTN